MIVPLAPDAQPDGDIGAHAKRHQDRALKNHDHLPPLGDGGRRVGAGLAVEPEGELALRRRLLPMALRWYSGLPDRDGRVDLAWLRRTGAAMTPDHWNNRMSRIVGAWIGAPGRGGEPLLLMVNSRDLDARFVLPPGNWVAELDTTQRDGHSTWRRADAEQTEHRTARNSE